MASAETTSLFESVMESLESWTRDILRYSLDDGRIQMGGFASTIGIHRTLTISVSKASGLMRLL